MSGSIYISTPSSTPVSLSQDIYLEGALQGQVGYQSPIYVELQNNAGVPITPTGSTLVGNTLTATLATPTPSGVALQFPNAGRGVSVATGDTGWRVQNGFYNYTPPTYPEKYAQLDTLLGANSWYKLKTPLRVNGVLSTQRFVDLSGIQGWAALNNLNVAVLDKLTGLMFTRGYLFATANWGTTINNALAYSVTINGNTYSNWYVPSTLEMLAFYGTYANAGSWTDPTTSVVIMSGLTGTAHSSDATTGVGTESFAQFQAGGTFYANGSNNFYNQIYMHDARNLIS